MHNFNKCEVEGCDLCKRDCEIASAIQFLADSRNTVENLCNTIMKEYDLNELEVNILICIVDKRDGISVDELKTEFDSCSAKTIDDLVDRGLCYVKYDKYFVDVEDLPLKQSTRIFK